MKKHLPNALTCANLACGLVGIVWAFRGELRTTALFVAVAAVFDFLDGFAARMLKVQSPMGKELDSLADMVTFGVLPGVVLHAMVLQVDATHLAQYLVFFISLMAALRLAKFNVDTRQSDRFIGLPTPAATLFVASLPFVWERFADAFDAPVKIGLLLDVSVGIGLLQVAEIPLFALKFKHFRWQGNEVRFVFLLLAISALVILQALAVPMIVLLYVLLSFAENKFLPSKAES
jgi:CDP-diacylglycerol--serine O-phosphatidyltransferase